MDKTRHSDRNRKQGWTGGIRVAAALWLLTALLAPPATAQAPASAPLDTLRETEQEQPKVDPRYAGADIDVSRKVLPEVQATTVPRDRTPDRTPRIDDPLAGAWRFHLARQAATAGNLDVVSLNLEQAVEAAPGESRYTWWRSMQAVRGLDATTLFQALPASVRSVIDSPLARGRALVPVHQTAVLATGIFWTLLVAALYLAWWPHLAHDLGALLLRFRRHEMHWKLPLLLPVAFVLVRPGWFGFLALMSVPLLIQTRQKSRVLLAAVWLTAVVLVFPNWPALRQAVPTVDPSSETTLLHRACTLPPSQTLISRLNTALGEARDPDRKTRLQTALAIQEARRGRFAQSDRIFREVLAREPKHFPSLVGLANNTYYQGRLDQAAQAYRQAARAHPDRGEIPYNHAQIFFKKLFVPEATEAMEHARALGFRTTSLGKPTSEHDGYSPVYYPPLTSREMTASCRFEAGSYAPLVTISTWTHLLGAPPVPLYALLGVPLLLAALLVVKWSRQNDPRCCENCGIPVCITCSRVKDTAWLCPACGEIADRARSDLILGTLLKNRSRAEGMAYSARIARIGRLVPGAGHFATGHFLAGWTRLAVLSLGLLLAGAGWTFDPTAAWSSPGLSLPVEMFHPIWLPLPAVQWDGWQTLPVIAGAALVVLVLMTALLDGPGLRRGIPERYSMSPQSETGAATATRESVPSRTEVMTRSR